MTKLSFGIAMAVMVNIAIIIVLVADGILIVEGDDGGPPSVITTLKKQEGFRGLPYDDTRGNATFGYGTRLPITKAEGAWLLETRLADTHARLAKAWEPYGGLNKARQGALLDMAYELGVEGLLGFHDMLAALERGDWAAASKAALASLWATEVPMRAIVIAAALKNG